MLLACSMVLRGYRCELNIPLFLNEGSNENKGTVNIISSDSPFIEWNVCDTTLLYKHLFKLK